MQKLLSGMVIVALVVGATGRGGSAHALTRMQPPLSVEDQALAHALLSGQHDASIAERVSSVWKKSLSSVRYGGVVFAPQAGFSKGYFWLVLSAAVVAGIGAVYVRTAAAPSRQPTFDDDDRPSWLPVTDSAVQQTEKMFSQWVDPQRLPFFLLMFGDIGLFDFGRMELLRRLIPLSIHPHRRASAETMDWLVNAARYCLHDNANLETPYETPFYQPVFFREDASQFFRRLALFHVPAWAFHAAFEIHERYPNDDTLFLNAIRQLLPPEDSLWVPINSPLPRKGKNYIRVHAERMDILVDAGQGHLYIRLRDATLEKQLKDYQQRAGFEQRSPFVYAAKIGVFENRLVVFEYQPTFRHHPSFRSEFPQLFRWMDDAPPHILTAVHDHSHEISEAMENHDAISLIDVVSPALVRCRFFRMTSAAIRRFYVNTPRRLNFQPVRLTPDDIILPDDEISDSSNVLSGVWVWRRAIRGAA